MSPQTRNLRQVRYDLSVRPFIVIWEVTRACALACVHCRAEAQPERSPHELSTEEGFRLIDQVAAFGSPSPLFVLTGGDPFERPDIFELIRYASEAGLAVSVSPSGTPALTRDNLRDARRAGAVALSLSLDGSTPELHDSFRGVDGVFGWTMDAWSAAKDLGFKVQVNTTVTPGNVRDLPGILRLVHRLGVMTWSVFLLVPTGRGAALGRFEPQEVEDVLNFLYDANKVVSVKATEAPQFRRVVMQRRDLEDRAIAPEAAIALGPLYEQLCSQADDLLAGAQGPIRRLPLDVNAGRGFAFISHVGAVHPSGFLPLAAGNVRITPLTDVYRHAPLFVSLRDPGALGGRCGACEFSAVCGGSRSRAFALTGDPLSEEPWCSYEPGSFPLQEPTQQMRARVPG